MAKFHQIWSLWCRSGRSRGHYSKADKCDNFQCHFIHKTFRFEKIQWKNGWTRPVSACVLDAELYATTMQFIFTHSEGQGKLLNCNKLVRPQKTMNKTVHLTFSSNVKSRNIRNETALKVQHSRNKFHV